MTYSRMDRVNELVKEALAEIIQEDLTDPRVGFATISRVSVGRDLRTATVGVSLLEDDLDLVCQAMEALECAKGFLRRELGRRVRLKYLPELQFVHDSSTAYAAHIQEVLNEIEPDDGWDAEPTEEWDGDLPRLDSDLPRLDGVVTPEDGEV